MKRQYILIFTILSLFTQCKKSKIETLKQSKIEQIFAENNYDLGGNVKFELFSDSTYNLISTVKSPNYEKTEKFNGFCEVKNDTIYFKPFEFEYTDSEKAVIKNNFIEFISEKSSFRIEIKKNTFKTRNKLDFTKFKDYAIFTYKPENKNSEYKPYDINQTELEEIDRILTKSFEENKSKLKSKNEYVKQCRIVTNANNEIEIWINCYCKNKYDKSGFKYNLIQMNDGGKCNISIKINLTKKEYSELNIAGLA
ncbi:hypothetical protein MW871_15785 [Flavobacterium sp. I-SCBP12n]|uniref:Uncharacterized protein n=1 Tax=Flavobacterium pygoscelis TaxID=2893176 RepID=A0A9X1Y123_9FLAO|nr:hypothetical protein [Flavobacterium pygoscelis]MCK8143352.1 hypothetical protein [Flavobacterium pygoscelis]